MRDHKKTNAAKNQALNQSQSENMDINKMCQMMQYCDKLPSSQIYPLQDVRRIRQRQEKNILCQMNINNLQLEFYDKFNKEIDSSMPVWTKMQQIQNLSNEEAVQQFRYYQSIKGREYEDEEEEDLIIGESRPNAGMFEDNFVYVQFKGEEVKDDYESILELKEEMVEQVDQYYYMQ